MEKIRGVNFGNWLVLEKWMNPGMFAGVEAEDEIWLNRRMDREALAERMREHRDTYVTREDFQNVADHGINVVRLPVPYFMFGDRPPLIGCVEYVDKAFEWAQECGVQILLDLHTVAGSQNGYDNGGITGVCKWCKNPNEVEFAITVLERMAERYGTHPALFGIEVLNEPISWSVYISAPSTGKAVDKEEARGSGYVPMAFLKQFYKDAYRRLRAILPPEKVIVFHDGFRLGKWKNFFVKSGMENVMLDTHIYIFAMQQFLPKAWWISEAYMKHNKRLIARAQKYTPVIVGEWCLSNKIAVGMSDPAAAREAYRRIGQMQLNVWDTAAGWVYWNYQLGRDVDVPMDEAWKNSWDLRRCWKKGWMPGYEPEEPDVVETEVEKAEAVADTEAVEGVETVTEEVEEIEAVAEKVVEEIEDADAMEEIEDAVDEIEDAVEEVEDAVEEAAETIEEAAGEVTAETAETIEEAAEAVPEEANKVAEEAAEMAEEAVSEAEDAVEKIAGK